MANTIADKLTYLSGTKDAIKQAIINKGIEISDTDTFRSYANKIEAIQSGGGGTTNITDGTKFGFSTFTTVPDSIIPYLETQTDLSHMFYSCPYLSSIPLFETSSVTDMSGMFNGCPKITSIPPFETSNLTYTTEMFYFCINLQTVPKLNVSRVTEATDMFYECSSLTTLGGFTGLKLDLDLAYTPLLTVESVMNIINNAADMTGSPKTLTLNPDVFNKLSSEQIATATAKGWNIAAV